MKKTDNEQNSNRIILPEDATDRRRGLLKKLAIGGVAGAALPTQWSKPVIDSVILPAHAQTTTGTLIGAGGGGGDIGAITPSSGESLIDFFAAPAHATVSDIENYCLGCSVQVLGGIIDAVFLTALGFNGCKGGTQWTNQIGSPIALTRAGSDWIATVLTYSLILSNFNLTGPKLCDSEYGGVPGVVNAGESCNFGGCPST